MAGIPAVYGITSAVFTWPLMFIVTVMAPEPPLRSQLAITVMVFPIRVAVAVYHRRLVYQNTVQTVHRAFYRSLADGIDDAQQLRGFKVIRCLAGRMPFSSALSHLLTP